MRSLSTGIFGAANWRKCRDVIGNSRARLCCSYRADSNSQERWAIESRILICLGVLFLLMFSCARAKAQQETLLPPPRVQQPVVPPVIQFSGNLEDAMGKALSGVVGVTFTIYDAQQGGAALWTETQMVTANESGRYTVRLGSESSGISELLISGKSGWLGIRPSGQREMPRTPLVGLRAVLDSNNANSVNTDAALNGSKVRHGAGPKPTDPPVTTAGGTVNFLTKFDATADITNSQIFDNGTNVGIGNTSPLGKLDVSGSFIGVRGATSSSVGVGLYGVGPNHGVEGDTSASDAIGVVGDALSTTGTTFGVYGQTFSPSGTGVIGNSLATSGNAVGVEGVTSSPDSVGVWGIGPNRGVEGDTSASDAIGVLGDASSTTGTTFGVYGLTFSPSGTGVIGNSLATSGNAVGVEGVTSSPDSVGVWGIGPNHGVEGDTSASDAIAVLGYSSSTTGTTFGVYGQTSSTSGTGVIGNSLATSGNAVGVEGVTSSPDSVGVWGLGPNRGVEGDTSASDAIGVFGDASSTTGITYGVIGLTLSPSGTGVYGNSLATSGNTMGVVGSVSSPNGNGVSGFSNAVGCSASIIPCGVGVYGQSGVNGNGVYGTLIGGSGFAGSAAVWGDTDSGWAVLGTATENTAMAALNNSAGTATMFMGNAETSSSTAPVLSVIGEFFGGLCIIDVSGNLTCSGAKHAAVPIDGGRMVTLSAVEAPGNWFEDFGSGHLSNGATTVTLDPIFAKTVNARLEYHVFLTPSGDCKGLYVARKAESSFEVRELSGGKSDVAFDYRIVARRKGYENVRMEDVTEQLNKAKEQVEALKARQGTPAHRQLLAVPKPLRPAAPPAVATPLKPAAPPPVPTPRPAVPIKRVVPPQLSGNPEKQ
jgi:hypothetical protein